MKLGKDEIQKLVLGGLMLIGLIYGYFSMLLGPLSTRQQTARKNIIALGPQIAEAKAQMRRTQELERNAPAATMTAQQVEAMIPEGSPVAWFPPRIAEFFKRQGVDKSATKLNNEFPEKDLSGFRRMSWGVDLPKVEFAPFAVAIAALENEEPLLEITSMQLDASRDDVESQHALITVNNLVKQ
jgi:hypothetical protein